MPLFWLSLALLAGLILGIWLGWPLVVWLAGAGLAVGLWGIERRWSPLRRLPTLPLPYALLLAALALGGARGQAARPDAQPNSLAGYNDLAGRIIVEGLLIDLPDRRDAYTNLLIQAQHIRLEAETALRPVEGRLLARVSPGGSWRYGDLVRVKGSILTPSEDEDFSYKAYLARQGIHSLMKNAQGLVLGRSKGSAWRAGMYRFKQTTLDAIYTLFPDPEASLLAGILLGVDSGLPYELQKAFQNTGTAHIIAISGFNMSILAGLFSKSFGRLWGKRRGGLAAAVAIAVYTLLVGAGPAVVRAALMSGLSLFARQVGRRQDGLNTLAFVGAGMGLANPLVLGDIGFQLSFMATLGLIVYAEPLSRGFERLAARRFSPETAHRLAGPVGEYFLFTLAAQVTTLPLILFHFQRLSLSAVLANPLILPAQPAVMILSGLAVLLGLVWQPLGQLAAWLAWPFAAYTIRVVEWFGGMPGGSLAVGEFGLPLVILSYVLLFGFTFARTRFQGLAGKLTPALGMTALGVVTVLVWRTALAAPDGRLHLVVLDVSVNGSSGSAVLVQTPAGRTLLIDGGPSPARLSDALGRRLPLGKRRLDWLLVAGSGEEQLQGLPRNLERFPPERVLWSGAPAGSTAARELRQAINELGIPLETALAGQTLDLGQGASLRVLAAGRRGSVLLLEWGGFQALLPLGVDAAALDALPADLTLPEVDVLLLADSGYAPSTPPEWLERFNPQAVLLSVAADDFDGRPDEALLDALEGRNLLRTDLNGWIEISTDGDELWVQVEKK